MLWKIVKVAKWENYYAEVCLFYTVLSGEIKGGWIDKKQQQKNWRTEMRE